MGDFVFLSHYLLLTSASWRMLYTIPMTSDQILSNVAIYIFTPIYQIVVGISILYFLYGAAKYVIDLNNPEKETTGKSHLFWGLIGLFIILSVGGILNALSGSFSDMFK
jgi:hypothetical protein